MTRDDIESIVKACQDLEATRNGRGVSGETVTVAIPAPGQTPADIEPYVSWLVEYGPRLGAHVIQDGVELPRPPAQPYQFGTDNDTLLAVVAIVFGIVGIIALVILAAELRRWIDCLSAVWC